MPPRKRAYYRYFHELQDRDFSEDEFKQECTRQVRRKKELLAPLRPLVEHGQRKQWVELGYTKEMVEELLEGECCWPEDDLRYVRVILTNE